jgi:hypothetical protein
MSPIFYSFFEGTPARKKNKTSQLIQDFQDRSVDLQRFFIPVVASRNCIDSVVPQDADKGGKPKGQFDKKE